MANLQICDLLWDFDAACHSDLRGGMAVRHHVVVFLVPSSTSSSCSPAIHAGPRPSRPSPTAACHDLPFLLVTLPAPLIARARGVGCEWEGRWPRGGGGRGGVRGAGIFPCSVWSGGGEHFQEEPIKFFGDYYDKYFQHPNDPGVRTVLGGQMASAFTASFLPLEHAEFHLAANNVVAGGAQGHDSSWFRNRARTQPIQRSG